MPNVFTKYIELFSGSACLYFALDPGKAVINDTNEHVINFYRAVQSDAESVYDQFAIIERSKIEYNKARIKFTTITDMHSRAAVFYYLNRNCFNGIFRTNTSGVFNVPFSASRVPLYPSRTDFCAAAKKLEQVDFTQDDFQVACEEKIEAGSFVYLDPPYYVPKQRIFKEYSAKPFSESDFGRLTALLNFIDKKGSRFLLSYPACGIMDDVARSWNSSTIAVRRTIAGGTQFRGYQSELLVSNF